MTKHRRLSERRVVMASNVARQWLFGHARPEFRFRVFTGSEKDAKMHVSELRRFRDGLVNRGGLASIPPIHDLGVQYRGDSLYVWSRNRSLLVQLKDHFEKSGLETTGMW